jgi:hypothetical protein
MVSHEGPSTRSEYHRSFLQQKLRGWIGVFVSMTALALFVVFASKPTPPMTGRP